MTETAETTEAPWKVGDPDPTPELEDPNDYCWSPHHLPGGRGTWYCTWPSAGEHPAWHVAAKHDRIVGAVWPVDGLPAFYVISPAHRPPIGVQPGETDATWTDRLAREGAALGVLRQCAIGWHMTCSAPDECRCACHAAGEAEDEAVVEVPLTALRELVGMLRTLADGETDVDSYVDALGLDDGELDEED